MVWLTALVRVYSCIAMCLSFFHSGRCNRLCSLSHATHVHLHENLHIRHVFPHYWKEKIGYWMHRHNMVEIAHHKNTNIERWESGFEMFSHRNLVDMSAHLVEFSKGFLMILALTPTKIRS